VHGMCLWGKNDGTSGWVQIVEVGCVQCGHVWGGWLETFSGQAFTGRCTEQAGWGAMRTAAWAGLGRGEGVRGGYKLLVGYGVHAVLRAGRAEAAYTMRGGHPLGG
jgi:hypothetical protein